MTTALRTAGFPSRLDLSKVLDRAVGERVTGGIDQLITQVSATQNYALNARKELGLSVYRYGLAGAVNLALGELCQAPVPTATEHDLVPAADPAIGTLVITLTTGAAVAANEYVGGWLHVNDGTGQGQNLRILSHPANAGAALCAFTCIDPLTVALVTAADSLCALTANPYNGAIVHPAPPTSKLIGVPVVAITAGLYGWFQTRGPAAVLTEGTVHIYQQVQAAVVANGAVQHANLSLRTGSTAAAAGSGNGTLIEDSAAAELVTYLADVAVDTNIDFGSLATIVGRVMRVEITAHCSLINLTLE